jgi:hypothetical protein
MPKTLTDEQNWAIITAPDTTTSVDLAGALNLAANTVVASRRRLRTEGWVCRVRYDTCPYCQRPVTVRIRSAQHAYHPECKPLAKLARQRERDADESRARDNVDRIRQWWVDKQEETRQKADQGGTLWTEEEDKLLLSMLDRPMEETCDLLHRSISAVNHRRRRLKLRYGYDD